MVALALVTVEGGGVELLPVAERAPGELVNLWTGELVPLVSVLVVDGLPELVG